MNIMTVRAKCLYLNSTSRGHVVKLLCGMLLLDVAKTLYSEELLSVP